MTINLGQQIIDFLQTGPATTEEIAICIKQPVRAVYNRCWNLSKKENRLAIVKGHGRDRVWDLTSETRQLSFDAATLAGLRFDRQQTLDMKKAVA